MGMEFAPRRTPTRRCDDVAAARALEAKGVEFNGRSSTRVCHMAFFTDPDGNDLMLHNRYAPYGEGDVRSWVRISISLDGFASPGPGRVRRTRWAKAVRSCTSG
jgi:hypothetical protein